MARRLVLVMVAFALAIPSTPASADWLTFEHDVAFTGLAEGKGPDWPDIAAVLPLRMGDGSWSPVAVRVTGGQTFVLGAGGPVECPSALFRVRPALDGLDRLACIQESGPVGLQASSRLLAVVATIKDGTSQATGLTFLGLDLDRVHVFDLQGKELWSRVLRPHDVDGGASPQAAGCAVTLLDGLTFYAACQTAGHYDDTEASLSAWNATTGAPLWTVTVPEAHAPRPPQPELDKAVTNAEYEALYAAWGNTPDRATALTHVGPHLFLSEQLAFEQNLGVALAPTARTGSFKTVYVDPSGALPMGVWTNARPDTGSGTDMPDIERNVGTTGNAQVVGLVGYSLEFANQLGQNVTADVTAPEATGYTGMAFDGVHFFAAQVHSLSAYTPSQPARPDFVPAQWHVALPRTDLVWDADSPLVLDGSRLLATATGPEGRTLFALDKASGKTVWAADATDLHGARVQTLDKGLLTAINGTALLLLGNVPGRIEPAVSYSTSYPQPGTVMTVGLRGGGSGGAITQAQVDWGDGKVERWVTTTTLAHLYGTAGAITATFQVRNDAGQSRTFQHVFYVGAKDPGQTWLQTALSAENQNETFFVLGLLATAGGALFSVLKVTRRRSLLRRELRALEEDFARVQGNATAGEDLLAERRLRARSLALRGKLDEGQSGILERRVDELRARHRLGLMDQRLHFLPYGVVLALQEHLRDGTLNLWERDHIVEVVHRDRILTAPQKAEVQAIIDGWFTRDARAGLTPGPAPGASSPPVSTGNNPSSGLHQTR